MTGTFGIYEEDGGRATVTFARELPQPPATVWPALTDPGALGHWFPAAVDADLRLGGAMRFSFPGDDAVPDSTGEITELDPGTLLTFTWGRDILRWELEPQTDGGTRLHFTQLLSDAQHAARDAAGWHVCLDRLRAHLKGEETRAPGTEPTPEWQALHDAYAARGFPAAAG